jgi:hypothetical protein
MAVRVGKKITEQASGGTITPSFSGLDIQANDWIGICITNDHPSGTTPTIAPPAGWTKVDSAFTVSGKVEHGWIYKIAASSSEAEPVITVNNDDCVAVVDVWRYVDTTTPIDVVATRKDVTNMTAATCNTASAAAGSVVLYSMGSRGSRKARFKLSECFTTSKYVERVAANLNHIIGYRQQEAAGTFGAVTAYWNGAGTAGEGGTFCAFALKNASGGAKAPDVRIASQELAWYGAFGATHDGVTWLAPDQFAGSGVTIGGLAVSATTPTVVTTVAETVAAPWGTATSLTTTDATADILIGGCHTISADLTGCMASVEFRTNLASTSARSGTAGVLMGFSDGANWSVFQLASKAYSWSTTDLHAAMVACATGKAATFATSGTLNWAAVTIVGYFWHKATANSGDALVFKNLIGLGRSSLTGGGAARPAKPTDIVAALTAGAHIELALLQSTKQVQVRSNIQIGDGTNATYYDHTAHHMEFPGRWSAAATDPWQMYWNATENALEIRENGKASDTIKTMAGVFASDVEQNYVMDASTSASATYLQTGSSMVNLAYTGDTNAPVTGRTFSGCDTVAFEGEDVTGVTITGTTSTNAACSFSASGATMDSCTIDGTGADYALELADGVTAITLTDCTLTAGSTDKVHVLDANGAHTVTITISGTTSLVAGDVTTAGATVYIAAPSPTLDATVLANTRAVLYNRTADAEISNTLVAGTSWTHTVTSGASSGDVLDLYTFKEGYQESVATIIYSGADATFAVQQAVDDAVDYYRTAESITDYTTLTEFNFYAPDIYIQSDDADGATSLKRMFIFYNGALTTEDGARYMRGGVTFRSAFDVVINRSAVALAVDNVSATQGLYFTDESVIRVTTDDGTSWIAPPSAPGSIRYAFGVSPGQIETGVSGLTGPESAQLMGLSTDVNVVQVAGVAVGGVGTEANPWGPA